MCLHALPIVGKEASSDILRRFRGDLGATHHSPSPIRPCPAPPSEGLPALRRRPTHEAGETIPRSRAPLFLSTHHYPLLWTMVSPQVKPLLQFRIGASGSMRGHPGGKLSATAPCPCRTVPPETYPAGPTLTCQAATAAAASILGLSSCFLVESASTTPRAFSIGSKGLSPPSLLG